MVANGKADLVGEDAIHHRAIVGKGGGKITGFQLHRTQQRIVVVHRLHLRQHMRIARHHHRTEIDDLRGFHRDLIEKCPLFGRGKTIGELYLRIAAQQHRALILQSRLDRGTHHANAGNRGDTQREAGEKHPKAAQTAAQLCPRNAAREADAHAPAPAFGPSMRPSTSRTTRLQRAASSGACVTKTKVAP